MSFHVQAYTCVVSYKYKESNHFAVCLVKRVQRITVLKVYECHPLVYIEGTRLTFELALSPWQPVRFFENNSEIHDICWGIMNKYFLILWILPSGFGWNWCQNWRFILSTMCANDRNFRVSTRPLRPFLVLFVTTFEQKHRFLRVHFEAVITIF